MKLDTSKYAAMVANAAARVKISSTIFKNFIADVKAVVDGNDDVVTAHLADYANHGNLKNKIINGNFGINKRVRTGVVTLSAGQYGHDRWKAGAAGCTYSFATVNNVTTITITAGSLQQVIEGISLFSGTHTLSWTGTAQGKIGAGGYGSSGITGNATGGTNLTIEFNTGSLSKVQLEEGSYKTPFEQRHFGLELALCQRYYEKSYNYADAPGTATQAGDEVKVVYSNTIENAQAYGNTRFRVSKRTTPTITIYPLTTPSNTGRVSNAALQDLAANSGAVTSPGTNGFLVYNGTGVSITTIANSVLYHWAADAEL